MFYIIGLGNPGNEYENTRHNTGRMALQSFLKSQDFSDLSFDKKTNALFAEGDVKKEKVNVFMPETFMNKSGDTVGRLKIKAKKGEIGNLIIVHDDLDIPFGKFKISFNKSSGGHKGVESIIKSLKTEAFVRIRVGISPVTAGGKMKKPSGEKVVGDFILAKFKPVELDVFKKMSKDIASAIVMIIDEGREKAMGYWNGLN